MGKALETTIRLSAAFAHTYSTRGNWLDYFEYAVKYSRHAWATVAGRRTLDQPSDENALVDGAFWWKFQFVAPHARKDLAFLHALVDVERGRA
jgi:hypothetical protein